jgi:sugar lactone lactonase YvrE
MVKTASLNYEVVAPHCCLLGERPVWDAKTRTICWMDILNGKIHEFCTVQKKHRTLQVKDMVSAATLCTNGNFPAALKCGLTFINRENGHVKLLHNPEAHLPENRFNDGKCDPAGHFWVGAS